MRVSGYLVPFPDPGAADLMSDHLEQELQATGPGKVLIRVSLPRATSRRSGGPGGSGGSFARKRLELLMLEGGHWKPIGEATSDSQQESEEVSWEVSSPGTLKCRLTNMSGVEGQFSLECSFVPAQEQ